MAWNSGLWWPWGQKPGFFANANTTLDLTGEYIAFVGYMNIAGQATSKTLDTTGSSSITFAVEAAPVFDNASSVFTIGFQGVDNTTGFPVRPDGTWTARSVVTTAANTTPTLTTSADYHVAIPTAGTVTLSHGDQVCIVYEFTTRAGSDALAVKTGSFLPSVASYGSLSPASTSNVSGAVANVANSTAPQILITFSDGTEGTLDGSAFVPSGVSAPALTWTNASNPDEYGLVFQVPFACSVDAIAIMMRLVDGTSDFQIDLVSDPLGTPASLIGGPLARVAENFGLAASEQQAIFTFAPVNLAANTNYCIAVKATGTGNIRWNRLILPTAGSRTLVSAGGTTLSGVTRNDGSGAYGSASTTILPPLAVRISNIPIAGNANILRGSVIA